MNDRQALKQRHMQLRQRLIDDGFIRGIGSMFREGDVVHCGVVMRQVSQFSRPVYDGKRGWAGL